MGNSFRIWVNDDNFSDYLNKLYKLSQDKHNVENFMRDASFEMHMRYIRPLMPQWNPNLIYSPLEPDNQIFISEGSLSTFELYYTGYTKQERTEGLEYVFSEFAVQGDPTTHKLDRDYAFFQETGIDSKVSPKYKPTHLHFAERGTKEYETEFHYKTMAFLEKLLNLEKWDRVNRHISIYDFE